ncbi:tRNA (adenosine(37)-N6)-dimethylallyltransferase MiaA [Croceitalea sp. MTPC5]|uniref:tRNA (adenosine(37)-N6)-dimethylallyltransferase MiaA n=1 Tax=Croceitalea sp. MTPC5 TaxID=3056565 RepID=UPI002B373A9B|nr:tRNA (adenosine(37)-N6)-dimethylallyltransferase MiaA [Croceitalea sp. MTPC5]
MMEKTLIAVIGPTAIGKTNMAIKLAQYFKTEIISADSRQFYQEMEIGTAVPSPEELGMVPHHFIQHKSIFESYSVGDFEKEAIAKLNRLFKSNDVIVIVGGSGLYVDAVVNGLDDFPDISEEIRTNLILEQQHKGLPYLQEKLKVLDPVYHKTVDLSNAHRVIRALEICIGTNKPYSSFLSKKKKSRSFKTIYVGLHAERTLIYKRINLRVDKMLEAGLLKEVKKLEEHKHLNALQTVGYKELFLYLEGRCSLNEAVEEIKKNTRRFAKRQLTWYRKNQNILWVDHNADLTAVIAKLHITGRP